MRRLILIFICVCFISLLSCMTNSEKPLDKAGVDTALNKDIQDTSEKNIIDKTRLIGVYQRVNVADRYSFLELIDTSAFLFTVNLCEGIERFKGVYNINNNRIHLHIKSTDFKGFSGDDQRDFEIEIISETLFKCHGLEDFPCGPSDSELLKKTSKDSIIDFDNREIRR